MKALLKIKHWQLFMLLIGIPLIIDIITGIAAASLQSMIVAFVITPAIMIFIMVIFFSWFYALGTNLQKKLPENVPMNVTRFKIFLFVPLFYIVFILLFMFFAVANAPMTPNPAIFFLIVPLHLFSMFCIFYSLYFVAKSLKTVELQRSVNFNDFSGEFFLIWFFPIGVWFIQPRINKLFANGQD